MRKKPFFFQNHSKSLALMQNSLFSSTVHQDMLFHAKTHSKTVILSPNLANHGFLHPCLFIDFLPPSLEKLGRQNADVADLEWRANVMVLTERGRWLHPKGPASYVGVTNSTPILRFCSLTFKAWKIPCLRTISRCLQTLLDVQSSPWRAQVPIGSFPFIAEITGGVEPCLWWCQYCLMLCIMDLPEGEW